MKAVILIAILIIFSGCSEQPQNPVQQTPVPKQDGVVMQNQSDPASMAETGVTEVGPSVYHYKPAGRRDPFRSLILGLKERCV